MLSSAFNAPALLALRSVVGDPLFNARALLDAADSCGEACLFTQTLALSGQKAGALWFNADHDAAVRHALTLLIRGNAQGRVLGVGLPLKDDSGALRSVYALIEGKSLKYLVCLNPALSLPLRTLDDSARFFAPLCEDVSFTLEGERYVSTPLSTKDRLNPLSVGGMNLVIFSRPEILDEIAAGAFSPALPDNTVLLDPVSDPYEQGQSAVRFERAKAVSLKSGALYAYVAPLGTEGAYVYSGLGILASDGGIAGASRVGSFAPWLLTRVGALRAPEADFDEMCRMVSQGLYDYLSLTHSKGFALSLSGGADSALCATLVFNMALCLLSEVGPEAFVKALSSCGITVPLCEGNAYADYIRAEVMPELLVTLYQGSEYSGSVTYNAANHLAAFLGAKHFNWSIAQVVSDYIGMYDALGDGEKLSWEKDDLTLQNIQARARLPGIWMVANRYGRLLLATSNLSEAVVGYCTMDGDTAGGFSPIAGIGKSVVRRINAYLEETGLLIGEGPERFKVTALDEVNAQAPTAELRPGGKQTDEGDLMPYVLLDAIRRLFVTGMGAESLIAALKADPELKDFDEPYLRQCLRRYLKLHARSQWKRGRFATGLHIEHDDAAPGSFWPFPVFSADLNVVASALKE